MPIRVTRQRRQQAQEKELSIWQGSAGGKSRSLSASLRAKCRDLLVSLQLRERKIGDDWNYWWAARFDNYQMIPVEIDNAVELGCGPYTNARIICQGRSIRHLYCSDPLLLEYMQLPNSWLPTALSAGLILIDDHPVEECPFASDYFDLTVLINVLDHVCDAESCLSQAIRITRPGGLLAVGQDLTNEEDIAAGSGDLAHPITLTDRQLDGFLMPKFEPVLYKVLPRNEGRNPPMHYGTCIFVGRKTA